MTDAPQDLLDDDAFLSAFLDALIPPSEPMPGAGSLGLAAGIRTQIASNPMFAAPVGAALAAVHSAALGRDPGGLPALDGDAREELLASLMPTQPVLGMLQLFVCTHYYQHPQALKGLGLPGGPPFPGGYAVEPTDPALLAKLESRRRS